MGAARSHPWLALAVATALGLAAAARTEDSPPGGDTTRPEHASFADWLDLTDDQMAALRQVHARHAAEFRALAESLRQARIDLRRDALRERDAKARGAEVSKLLARITELRAATLREMSPILTPAQRDALARTGSRPGSDEAHADQRSGEARPQILAPRSLPVDRGA